MHPTLTGRVSTSTASDSQTGAVVVHSSRNRGNGPGQVLDPRPDAALVRPEKLCEPAQHQGTDNPWAAHSLANNPGPQAGHAVPSANNIATQINITFNAPLNMGTGALASQQPDVVRTINEAEQEWDPTIARAPRRGRSASNNGRGILLAAQTQQVRVRDTPENKPVADTDWAQLCMAKASDITTLTSHLLEWLLHQVLWVLTHTLTISMLMVCFAVYLSPADAYIAPVLSLLGKLISALKSALAGNASVTAAAGALNGSSATSPTTPAITTFVGVSFRTGVGLLASSLWAMGAASRAVPAVASLAARAFPGGTGPLEAVGVSFEAAAVSMTEASEGIVKGLYDDLGTELAQLEAVIGSAQQIVDEIEAQAVESGGGSAAMTAQAETWWQALLPSALYSSPFRIRKRHLSDLLARLFRTLRMAEASRTRHKTAIETLQREMEAWESGVPKSALHQGIGRLNSEFRHAGANLAWPQEELLGPDGQTEARGPDYDYQQVVETPEQARYVEDLHLGRAGAVTSGARLRAIGATLQRYRDLIDNEQRRHEGRWAALDGKKNLLGEARTDKVVQGVAKTIVKTATRHEKGVVKAYYKEDT